MCRSSPLEQFAAVIESISAVTLAAHNMSRAVAFYRMLGFEIVHGGDDAAFTSLGAGTSFVNLVAQPAARKWSWWGRVIFYHSIFYHSDSRRPLKKISDSITGILTS
jgi:catechol-2,3-dioxygenase